jgi:hypothetical protein
MWEVGKKKWERRKGSLEPKLPSMIIEAKKGAKIHLGWMRNTQKEEAKEETECRPLPLSGRPLSFELTC